MKKHEINYNVLSFERLTSPDKTLVTAAIEAMKKAYAPYSNFMVGSAVLMQDGQIIKGNNQENAAYPSGLCAERVALFAAKSASSEPIVSIAIVANNAKGEAADAFACGNCRQVMLEYANQKEQTEPIRVLMRTHKAEFLILEDVRQLLPFTFNSNTLG